MLPPEILELIVDEMRASGDRIYLPSLLFVSTLFRSVARPHLFKQVSFTHHVENIDSSWDTLNKRAKLLLDVIEGDPSILHHFTSLTICIDDSLFGVPRYTPDGDPILPDDHLIHWTTALRALSEAPNLNALEIRHIGDHATYGGICSMDSVFLPRAMVYALIGIRCKPTMTSLSLSRMSAIPWLLLTGIPHKDRLTHIVLDGTRLQRPGQYENQRHLLHPFTEKNLPAFLSDVWDSFKGHMPLQNLESLTLIGYAITNFSWFPLRHLQRPDGWRQELQTLHDNPDPTFQFPNLKELTFSAYPEIRCVPNVAHLLEKSPNLEHLSIMLQFDLGDRQDALLRRPFHLHSLRKLELYNISSSSSSFRFVSDFIRLNEPMDNLELLTVSGIPADEPLLSQDPNLADPSWRLFKDTVERLPSLKKLEVFECYVSAPEDVKIYEEKMEMLRFGGRIEVVSQRPDWRYT